MSSDYNKKRPSFEETTSNKTMRKIRENPFVPMGMAGFFIMAAYGFHNFKNRPANMSASMYIMRFRVFAQSVAVGAMGLGIGYSILKEHFYPSHPAQSGHNGNKHESHKK